MKNTQKIREDLWKSVDGLSNEQLNEKVGEDRWTIAQVLEHLLLIEENAVKGIKAALTSEENATSPQKPVHLTVDRSRKVPAPSFLEPTDEYQTLESLKERMTKSREALKETIKGKSDTDLTQKSFKHPVFGLLDVKQWISFIGYHEQRHLEQIEEIKSELKKGVS